MGDEAPVKTQDDAVLVDTLIETQEKFEGKPQTGEFIGISEAHVAETYGSGPGLGAKRGFFSTFETEQTAEKAKEENNMGLVVVGVVCVAGLFYFLA